MQTVDLTWSGANDSEVNIWRSDLFLPLITTENDGSYTDDIGAKGGGSYDYFVCEAIDFLTCSNVVTVIF